MLRGQQPRKGPDSIARYAVERLKAESDPGVSDWLGRQLKPLPRGVSVPASAHVRVHRFTVTRGQVVAFERNISYQMSEDLKQAGGNEALEKPVELEITLAEPCRVYTYGRNSIWATQTACASLSIPWQPSVFALTRDKLAPEGIVASLLEE